MKVLGLGHVLPTYKNLVDADHPNPAQLAAIERAGYNKYRVSTDSARDMGAQAVLKALEESGHSIDDIGFIVAGQSGVPDFIGIDFACQVGAELGGLNVRTINLVEGCGSAISTWFVANGLIEGLKAEQVGIIVLVQRVSDAHYDRFGLMTAPLSDGAVAAVVSKVDASSTKVVFRYRGSYDISCSRFVDMMRVERGGGVFPTLLSNHDSREDKLGRDRIMELYRFSNSDLSDFLKLRADNMLRVIESTMAKAGWRQQDDFFLLHTLEGRQSIETLASSLGVSLDKTNASLMAEMGHMGCVDPLISLDILRKQGTVGLGSRIVMSTISTGMKWGCCLLECEEVERDGIA